MTEQETEFDQIIPIPFHAEQEEKQNKRTKAAKTYPVFAKIIEGRWVLVPGKGSPVKLRGDRTDAGGTHPKRSRQQPVHFEPEQQPRRPHASQTTGGGPSLTASLFTHAPQVLLRTAKKTFQCPEHEQLINCTTRFARLLHPPNLANDDNTSLFSLQSQQHSLRPQHPLPPPSIRDSTTHAPGGRKGVGRKPKCTRRSY